MDDTLRGDGSFSGRRLDDTTNSDPLAQSKDTDLLGDGGLLGPVGDDLSAASNNGNYCVEIALVLKLTRSPVHPSIAKHRVPVMKECKQSIEYALEYLDALRDTCYSHFLLHDFDPMPFSVPLSHFPTRQVFDDVCRFLEGCGFARVSLAEAVRMDVEIDRCGVMDELSHHHGVQDDILQGNKKHNGEERDKDELASEGDVACFVCHETKQCNSLSARTTPFFVVELRNIHAEVEFGLLPTQSTPKSTPSSKQLRK